MARIGKHTVRELFDSEKTIEAEPKALAMYMIRFARDGLLATHEVTRRSKK